MRNDRGFTLIELMIVLVIMLTVTAGIYKLLNGTQRLSRAQAERVDLQSNVRAAALVIPSELREINTVVAGATDQNDILVAQPTTIRYRAMRGVGFVCQATATEIRLNRDTYSGSRAPQAGPHDAAYVFVQGPATGPDTWLPVIYAGLSTTTCPGAASPPAYALTVPSMTVPPNGTPVRIYEVMELSLYVADGKSWLGARSVSGNELSPQPLLGPLRAADGLEFKYYDGTDVETATLANIKSVRLTVRGETSQRTATGGGTTARNGYVQDSLVTRVALRNSFRP